MNPSYRAMHACRELGLLDTPLFRAAKHMPRGMLFVKREGTSLLGSIKARCAYYMLCDAVSTQGDGTLTVVESSSGNLALALHALSRHFGVSFLCLADHSLPQRKQQEMADRGMNVVYIEQGDHPDCRSARIAASAAYGSRPGHVWLNQYANPANVLAHKETTGPEIWEQTGGDIAWVVASVGSGGTICGLGTYFKQINPGIKIVGVEPLGSTSFGGCNSQYISAGSGMKGPSELLRRYGQCIDYYVQVDDCLAARACREFEDKEGCSLGLTSGHNLVAASIIGARYTGTIVVISADDGDHYEDIVNQLLRKNPREREEPALQESPFR